MLPPRDGGVSRFSQKDGVKLLPKAVAQEHPQPEAANVGSRISHPAANVGEEIVKSPLEGLGGELVTGRPIVHVGQESAHRRHSRIEIGDGLDQEGVELILLKIGVGELAKKRFPALGSVEVLGHFPQDGGADSDHPVGIHRRHQGCLEGLVSPIRLRPQGVADGLNGMKGHRGMMLLYAARPSASVTSART